MRAFFYIQNTVMPMLAASIRLGCLKNVCYFREDLVAFDRVLWRFAREKPGVFLFYTDGCLTLFI